MISVDTNLLFIAANRDSAGHLKARAFVADLAGRRDVAISEFALVELYRLLRNPIVFRSPLTAPEAVEVIQGYRGNSNWSVAGLAEGESQKLHDELWKTAAEPQFAYRRIFDARLALSLRRAGVREFATTNTKDFEGFGFARVWDPLAG